MAKPPTVTREATSTWTLAWQGRLADRITVPVPLAVSARVIAWLVRRPVKTAAVALVLATWLVAGLWAGVGLAAALALLDRILRSPGWAASGRVGRSYRTCQARGKLRRAWPDLMAKTGLVDEAAQPMRHGWFQPTATGLRCVAHNGPIAKTAEQVAAQTQVMAGLLGVHSVRSRPLDSASCMITFHTRNPFAETIRLDDLPRVVSRSAVPLGVSDEGEPLVLSLKSHLLLLGLPGSGKSSIIWVILDGIQQWDDQPRPQVDVVDLKMGVELGSLDPAAGGIATNYVEEPKLAEKMVHDTDREMLDRLKVMKANNWRNWRPEYAPVLGPRRIMIIDEFLALPNKVTQKDDSPLRRCLFMHRAAGLTVVGASQLTQVDASALGRLRNLFPTKIMLAAESAGMVTAAMGSDAQSLAPAHKLQLPWDAGRFYMAVEGRSGFSSGKAAFVDDEKGEHLPIAQGRVAA